MIKIQLKITPSLSSIVRAKAGEWFIIDKEFTMKTTLGDLLAELASQYTDFRKMVYDPQTGTIGEQINVAINRNLLPPERAVNHILEDGDNIILLPAYTGG